MRLAIVRARYTREGRFVSRKVVGYIEADCDPLEEAARILFESASEKVELDPAAGRRLGGTGGMVRSEASGFGKSGSRGS